MSLTKADIVKSVAKNCGYSKQKSSEIIERILELIKNRLESGEDVLITNFGKFCVKKKKARKGWNISRGENATIARKRVIAFRCSGKLRAVVPKNWTMC